MRTSRRQFLKAAARSGAAADAGASRKARARRVVVIGGGFAGASAARALKRGQSRRSRVTLVEANADLHRLPVLQRRDRPGCASCKQQQFGYDKVAQDGVVLAMQAATAVDAQAKSVTLANGTTLPYDRLVLAPGIDLRFDAPARLRRARGRGDAARLEGGRADAAAAPPARGDGGRRHRGHRRRRPIRSAARPARTSARA